eukprot:2457656-Alexandrium_andersonii.AAC.1
MRTGAAPWYGDDVIVRGWRGGDCAACGRPQCGSCRWTVPSAFGALLAAPLDELSALGAWAG